MNKNALIPRRKVLGLGVALAGLCAGCAVLPDAGSAESAARSGAASASASTGAEEKAPRTELNGVHLRDNPELYTVYDDSGVVTMYLTVSRGNDSENTNHSWAEINGLVYDPLFAEAKNYNKYYGAPYGVYELHPILHVAL